MAFTTRVSLWFLKIKKKIRN